MFNTTSRSWLGRNFMLELEIFHLVYPLAKQIAISFHTWEQRESWIIILHYRHWQGLGEANPFKPITGDSTEEILRQVALVTHMPLDPINDDFDQLHNYLQHTITCPSLMSAIDMAYHDLMGQIQQQPVYQYYTIQPHFPNIVPTIFLQDSLDNTRIFAQQILDRLPDPPMIKIRIKGNEEDIERVKTIQQIMPPQTHYMLDANQGFANPDFAVKILQQISATTPNIILIEEPCAKGNLEQLKYVKDHLSNMMVFADESASSLEDVQKIIETQSAHGINIKLQKAGGIWPARKIAKLCEKNNLQIIVGTMLEGPIGIMAGLHFVAGCANVLFAELDSDLDLPSFTRGGTVLQNGRRILNRQAGLGICLDEACISASVATSQLQINRLEIRNEFF